MIDFSPQQAAALSAVKAWFNDPHGPQCFLVGGYAGTGKTELARHFAEGIDGDVYFVAYTGKAAEVLHRRGCPNAGTIHSVIYSPKEKGQQRLTELMAIRIKMERGEPHPNFRTLPELDRAIRAEKENLARPFFKLNLDSPLKGAKLVVIDEYSMVGEEVGKDLTSFGCKVLALGDPAQLPPVGDRPFWKGEPDVMLTDIHRQAKENPIVWMASEVRQGRPLPLGYYGESQVCGERELGREGLRAAILAADQVLVGRNDTRQGFNARIRQLRNRQGLLPEVGDRLICLRNNHDAGLLNGQMWEVEGVQVRGDDPYLGLSLVSEDKKRSVVASAHREPFLGHQIPAHLRRNAEEFDYGYAITVHKSQGSEWPKVLVYDEWRREDRARWLYTALTRAREQVVVVGA